MFYYCVPNLPVLANDTQPAVDGRRNLLDAVLLVEVSVLTLSAFLSTACAGTPSRMARQLEGGSESAVEGMLGTFHAKSFNLWILSNFSAFSNLAICY